MKNSKIESKTGNTYVRVAANSASTNKTVNLDSQNDSSKNLGSQKIKMNPINYWCGPHFLFYIN